jgi:hypothetical protein
MILQNMWTIGWVYVQARILTLPIANPVRPFPRLQISLDRDEAFQIAFYSSSQ